MKRLSLNNKENSKNKLDDLNFQWLRWRLLLCFLLVWGTLNLKAFIHPDEDMRSHTSVFIFTLCILDVNLHSLPTFTFLYKGFYYVLYLFAPVQTIFPELNIRAVVLGSRILIITAANRWENKKMQKNFTKSNDWQKIRRQKKIVSEVWKRDKLMPCESLK